MNTQLQTLFEVYNISDKDQYEIQQIFSLLPTEKKMNFLNNFPQTAAKLKKIHEDIKIEQSILITEWIKELKDVIKKVKVRYQ